MNKDKTYRIIISILTIAIFVVMVVLSGNVLLGDSKYSVEAHGAETIEFDDMELFKQLINISCSVFEYSNIQEGGFGTKDYVITELKGRLGLDSLSPMSLIESQMVFLKEYEDLVVEETFIENVESEDEDIHGIYEIGELSEVNVRDNTTDSDKYKDDVIVLGNEPKEDNQEAAETGSTSTSDKLFHEFEIISTPVPAPAKIAHNINKPLIFIYHTHGTESYRPESVGNYHSLTRKYTVRRVGDELTNNLEDYGLKVVHNDKVHDYPSYQGSYSRSLETLKSNMSKNKDLKIIFDIHRDGIDKVDALDSQSYKLIREKSVVNINGESVATFSIVLGGGNENLKELKQFAYHIKAVSDKLYPGLAGKIIIKQSNAFKYKLNQYKSDYSALLEIGNNTNTIDEALATTKYLSNILAHSVKTFVSVNDN